MDIVPAIGSKPWRGPALALAALAILAPQLLGGATTAMALAIYALGCLVCVWVAVRARSAGPLLEQAPAVVLGAALAAVWTALQALPLPCAWILSLQPERKGLIEELSALGVETGNLCSISASPGSTASILPLAVLVAALLASATAVARSGQREILLRGIALSSIAMACVGLGHWVMGEERVFGLYKPVFITPRLLVAPLLNENHFAGLLALGWPVCLAHALASRRVDRTILWGTGAVMVFSAGTLSLSRGGAAALLLGGGAFVVAQLARRKSGKKYALLGLVATVSLAAGAYVGYARLAEEFAGDGTSLTRSKLALVAALLPLLSQHPLVGVGRGALGDVSATVLLANSRALYTENLPSQWAIELGIPCALLVAGSALVSLLLWRYRTARGTELGLACGLAALIAQNLVDFSLELPGVAVTAAVALGCLTARERPWLPIALAPITGAGAIATAVSLMVATPWLTIWSKDSLSLKIQQSVAQKPTDLPAFQRAIRSYPFDPAFVLLGAAAAYRAGDRLTGRWINLALEVAPGWAGPHLLAADILEQRGALQQAALELSLAAAREPWPATGMACKFVGRHPKAAIALEAANENPQHRQASLEQLTLCLPPSIYPVEGDKFLEAALREFPKSRFGHQQYVLAARSRGDHGEAIERAKSMRQALPTDPEALVALGEALLAHNEPVAALDLAEQSAGTLRRHRGVMTLEAKSLAQLDEGPRFAALINEMLALHGRTVADRAYVHQVALEGEYARGNYLGALAHAQAAYDLTQDVAVLELAHQSAIRSGVTAVALRTGAELCQLRHRAEKYCRKAGSYGPTTGSR